MAFGFAQVGLPETFGSCFFAVVVAWTLELGEEVSGFLGEEFGSAEVSGALAAVFDVVEAVVGAEASSVLGAVGGDDGAATGEDLWVRVNELEWGGHCWTGCIQGRTGRPPRGLGASRRTLLCGVETHPTLRGRCAHYSAGAVGGRIAASMGKGLGARSGGVDGFKGCWRSRIKSVESWYLALRSRNNSSNCWPRGVSE